MFIGHFELNECIFLPAIPASRNAKLIAQKTQNLINNPIYLCADSRSVRRGGNSQNHGGNAEETAHEGPLDYKRRFVVTAV